MYDLTQSDWLQLVGLSLICLLSALFGIHAYFQHKLEVVKTISPRKWMFWLYSAVFLLISVISFLELCVEMVFHQERMYFHLGYSSLLLMFSYAVLLGGARKKPKELS